MYYIQPFGNGGRLIVELQNWEFKEGLKTSTELRLLAFLPPLMIKAEIFRYNIEY